MSPTPLAWFVHQLPDWLLRLGAVVVLQCEITIPLMMFFAPIRRLRLFSFYVQVCFISILSISNIVCGQVFFFPLIPLFIPFCQLFLQLFHILTGNCGLLNLLSIALSVSLLDDEHFNSSAILKKKGQEKKSKGMSSYL